MLGMRALACFIGVITSFIVLTSCGGSSSPYGNSLGIDAKSYCDSINRVVDFSLDNHLTRTRADLPELYNQSIQTLIRFTPSYYEQAKLEQEILSSGNADSSRLSDCRDILRIQEAWARNPGYSAQSFSGSELNFKAEPSLAANINWAKAEQSLARSDPSVLAYNTFVAVFANYLDLFSSYQATSRADGSSLSSAFSYGVVLDIQAEQEYGKSTIRRSFVRVEATQEENCALKRGDRIRSLKIGGNSYPIYGIGLDELKGAFERNRYSTMEVEVVRTEAGKDRTETVTIIGTPVSSRVLDSATVAGELLDDTIYVKIFGFDDSADMLLAQKISKLREDWMAAQVAKALALTNNGDPKAAEIALKKLKETNIDDKVGIILDLRFNPGGDLAEARKILGLFLRNQVVGKFIQRRNAQMISKDLTSTETGHVFKNPLVVLVNHASASASDFVSQVVKETGRGLVLGERTFGKGIGQNPIPLSVSGVIEGVLHLTTFFFHGPSGENIQQVGTTPHISTQSIRALGIETDIKEIVSLRSEAELRCSNTTKFEPACIFRMEDFRNYTNFQSRLIARNSAVTCSNCLINQSFTVKNMDRYMKAAVTALNASASAAAGSARSGATASGISDPNSVFSLDPLVRFAGEILNQQIRETNP